MLTPLFRNLPEAVLAALIIHAVSHLWKVGELRGYYAQRVVEFWLALATLVGVITLDVLPGLVIGVASMLLLVIYHASRPHLAILGRKPDAQGVYGDVDHHPDYEHIPQLLVLRLEAPLFYANASPVRDRVKELVGACETPPAAVIIDTGASAGLDVTSAEMLKQLASTLRSANVELALAGVRVRVIEMARRSGLLDALGEDRIFQTIDEAIEGLGRNASSW